MNLPAWFAWRYFFSKEIKNVIHWISRISQLGITICAAALIIILSVFNGLQGLISDLYNTFDPGLKVIPVEGKYFEYSRGQIDSIKGLSGFVAFTDVIEEKILLEYNGHQIITTAKAVDPTYLQYKELDSQIVLGEKVLFEDSIPYAIAGVGVAAKLDLNLYDRSHFLKAYFPNAKVRNMALNPTRAFQGKVISVSGLFSIQEDYDKQYVLFPIGFIRDLVQKPTGITSLELEFDNEANLEKAKSTIQNIFGNGYKVLDRNEQHASFYRIVKIEKLFTFLILSFIILIAAFNLVGSLLMLSFEKKKDMMILSCLGAEEKTIRKIFLLEGVLLSLSSAVIGLLLGIFITWLQMKYGLVKLSGSGETFIVDAYPVALELRDIISVFIIVVSIGLLSTWLPANSARKNLVIQDLHN